MSFTLFQTILFTTFVIQYAFILYYLISSVSTKDKLQKIIGYVNWLAMILVALLNVIVVVYNKDSLFIRSPHIVLIVVLLIFLPYIYFAIYLKKAK